MFFLYALLLSRLVWAVEPVNDRLQRAVDDSMNRRNGAAVAMDVQTGQVLASYHMDVAARRLVPPGSSIKPFTLMALMEAGLVQEHTALFCPRKLRIGTHTLDCSHPTSPDPLDAVQALAYSCNHFFATLAGQLPLSALPQEFSRMGFGSMTGKWHTELPGVVEQPQSIEAMQLMSVGEEGIKVTPLGLAEGYRTLARQLRDSQTAPDELHLLLKGLEAAVNSGTGQAAASKYAQVAGKTGTAAGHAWFAGFVPAEKPEVVIVVFLEHGTGGADAAPIAGRVINSYYAGGRAAQKVGELDIPRLFKGGNILEASLVRELPSWHRRGGCGINKRPAQPTLAPQTGWSGMLKCFAVPDHPVRSIKGSFATSLLMSRPPLLHREGSCITKGSAPALERRSRT